MYRVLLLATLVSALAARAQTIPLAATAETVPHAIPRLNGIVVDGDEADWKGRGFGIGLFTDGRSMTRAAEEFGPTLRLGWNELGLLIFVTVQDDETVPRASKEAEGDSVEFTLAPAPEAPGLLTITQAPGTGETPGWGEPVFKDLSAPVESAVHAKSQARDKGWNLEMLVEWRALGVAPALGSLVRFQPVIIDHDTGAGRVRVGWNGQIAPEIDPLKMPVLRLAQQAAPDVVATASGRFDASARTRIQVTAAVELAGQTVTARRGNARAAGVLTEKNGTVSATLFLPLPEGPDASVVSLRAGKTALPNLSFPSAAAARARLLLDQEILFSAYAFSGQNFPACDFAQPLAVEALIGPYSFRTTFYDKDLNAVSAPTAAGRFGAVVEVTPAAGRPFRRFQTLYRMEDKFDHNKSLFIKRPGYYEPHPSTGIDPAVAQVYQTILGNSVAKMMLEGFTNDMKTAVLLAALHEAKAGDTPDEFASDPPTVDRQWWVQLKRKLYPLESAPQAPFVSPRPQDPPAPELREGTAEEAGMQPGAAEAIDAVLQAWAAESDEAFAVALARNGVLFLHKAYGTREGQPMSVDTPSWMASITKFMSGTLMMQLIDQGLVDPDASLDTYLPALKGIEVAKPLSVRHLYTHTNGLNLGVTRPLNYPDHWGDELHDLEEIVAGLYPHLPIGAAHVYNGVGHALGGKVIETITGEALPLFYKHHLLDPLGMAHTDARDGSAQTMSVPLDMARLGQMLLNKGAYGNLRFFSEETYAKMLPVRLNNILGEDTTIEWGIGPVWMPLPGLSEKTLGHGAASAATFRVDPENQLVIVMTCNGGGKGFVAQHGKFIEAVVAQLK